MKTVNFILFLPLIFVVLISCGGGSDPVPDVPLPDVEVGFLVSDSVINQNSQVTFSDLSTGVPSSWNWTFEGGTPASSSEKSPVIAYSLAGVFSITLTATNEESTNSLTKQIVVLPTDGLRAHYKLDGNANDESNSNFSGTIDGGVDFFNNRYDIVQSSGNFDGDKGAIDIGSEAGNDIRTISLWFSTDVLIDQNISDAITLIGRNNTLSLIQPHEFFVYFGSFGDTNGKLAFTVRDASNDIFTIFSNSSSWSSGQWIHVIAMIDPVDGMSLYLNGEKQNQTGTFTGSTGSIDKITAIGRWGDFIDRHFDGKIDDLRLFDRALTSEEIRALNLE